MWCALLFSAYNAAFQL